MKQTSRELTKQAETIKIMKPAPVPEPPPEEIEPEDPEPKTYPPLPFTGLSSPVIKNIQIAMNEYCETRGISEDRIKEDGQWGPETQGRWSYSSARADKFARHALDNHSEWRNSPDAQSVTDSDLEGSSSWKKVSRKLVGAYPGYTATKKGMLAFCIDAYNDNTDYGKVGRGDEKKGSTKKKRRPSKEVTPVPVPIEGQKPVPDRVEPKNPNVKDEKSPVNIKSMAIPQWMYKKRTIGDWSGRRKGDAVDKITIWWEDGVAAPSRVQPADLTQDKIKKIWFRVFRPGWRAAKNYSDGGPSADALSFARRALFGK